MEVHAVKETSLTLALPYPNRKADYPEYGKSVEYWTDVIDVCLSSDYVYHMSPDSAKAHEWDGYPQDPCQNYPDNDKDD